MWRDLLGVDMSNIKIDDVAIEGKREIRGRGSDSGWNGTFNKMKIGQSFKLSDTPGNEKQIRNAKASANAWNKKNNNIKIEWRNRSAAQETDGVAGVRFGPVAGPAAAKPAEAPAEAPAGDGAGGAIE